MYGALRLVSVEKGYDPRDFALMAFGGAGPLHANALGKLMNSWPVIIPPGPGVLCAYGDATTRVRDEASRTYIRRFSETSAKEVSRIFSKLAKQAAKTLDSEGVARKDQETNFQVDIRYHGQGLLLTVDFDLDELKVSGLEAIGDQFDEMHEQLFTFALPEDKELVNLRAVVQGKPTKVRALSLPKGTADPSKAKLAKHTMFVDGKDQPAVLYDRAKLKSGNVIKGPAVVLEMDATSVILPGYVGKVDDLGNILITPAG
jgi:N-methylhydantoinase A